MVTIRSAYSPRERALIQEFDASRTKQSFRDECDIQNILQKFQRTGIIEHARRHSGMYGNFPDVDFKTAMDIVAKGKSMWEDLPSSLKKRFKGPEEFVAFATDPENLEELRELGLAKPLPAEPTAPGEPVVPEGDGGAPEGGGTES